MLRQRLAAARALYSEKRYDAAAEAFTGLLVLLDDATLARAAGADLPSMSALATGFRDLSLAADEQARAAADRQSPPASTPLAAATPPDGVPASPPAAPGATDPAAAPAPAPSGTSDTAAPAAPAEPAGAASADVVPPVAIAQAIPPATEITVPVGAAQTILLDILIDETGHVERAEVRRSVNRIYEAQLVAATRGWRYTPATQGGRPVKYQRTLEVTLSPRN